MIRKFGKFRRRIANAKRAASIASVAAICAVTLQPKEARSQIQILAAPAICAGTAGLGCVLIGVAAVGGGLVWLYQNTQTGQRFEIRDPGNIPGVQETHAVANRNDCDRMERKFRGQGRRLRLVDRLQSANPNDPLRWVCVFQGEDAAPGYFNDNRLKD